HDLRGQQAILRMVARHGDRPGGRRAGGGARAGRSARGRCLSCAQDVRRPACPGAEGGVMGGSRRAGRPMLLTSILTVLGTVACGDRDPGADARLSLLETLAGADTAGYARATEARPFTFPRDHGPHPAFRTEWWYVTGNLADAGGRRFGFQLTIFRNALAPTAPDLASGWATNQAYMGHFTLTDVDGDRFQAFERFSRGAAGLAGAEIDPRLRVWIDQWVIQGASGSAASGTDARDTAANGSGIFPLRLRASADAVALDLTLDAGKPPVLQGEDGLSQKGPE